MTSTAKPVLTGGCQCGAIRFALSAPPAKISICHCRMCQKAPARRSHPSPDIGHGDFVWTKGKPGRVPFLLIAERDFCRDCGTPAELPSHRRSTIEIMTRRFDRPNRLVPTSSMEPNPGSAGCIIANMAEPDHAAELRAGETWKHRQPPASGTMIDSGDPLAGHPCYNGKPNEPHTELCEYRI